MTISASSPMKNKLAFYCLFLLIAMMPFCAMAIDLEDLENLGFRVIDEREETEGQVMQLMPLPEVIDTADREVVDAAGRPIEEDESTSLSTQIIRVPDDPDAPYPDPLGTQNADEDVPPPEAEPPPDSLGDPVTSIEDENGVVTTVEEEPPPSSSLDAPDVDPMGESR